MSIPGFDSTTIDGETTESLLACLSQTINSISGIGVEEKVLVEISSYLYRVFPVIKMLERSTDTNQILESVSRRIQLTNQILDGFQASDSSQLHTIIKQMEGVIRYLGEGLASIPSSAFSDHDYAEIAVRSLSQEMRTAQIASEDAAVDQYPEEVSSSLSMAMGERLASIPSSAFLDHDYAEIAVRSLSQEMKTAQIASEDAAVDRYPEEVSSSLSMAMGEVQEEDSDLYPVRNTNSVRGSRDFARYVEPPYASFFCPLTNKILQDPVTIQSGATFERHVIAEWFQTQVDQGEVTCPATGHRLSSKLMFSAIALKSIIEEWKERNEREKIKVIHAALSLATSEDMIMEALMDLKSIIHRRPDALRELLSKGFLPLIVNLLKYKDSPVRLAVLEILLTLAEDDSGKELIGQTAAIFLTVGMISSRIQPIKHAALLLLVELSNSVAIVEKFGRVAGGILMLIRTKYDSSTDMFSSEAACKILKNLAQSPYNIKCMAENGFFEPLLDNLAGSEEIMKVEMANYLAEVVLCHNDSAFVARKASPTLIQMARSDNAYVRKAALNALVPVSSLHDIAKTLVEAGMAEIVWEEMFGRNTNSEASNALKEAAGVLANLLESDLDLERIELTSQGHTISSDFVASSIVYMLTNSNVADITLCLVRTISCIMKWSMPNIVSAIGDSEACNAILELINSPDEQLGVAALKVAIKLAQHIGQVLVDKLCKIHGQPHALVQRSSDIIHITERQVLSVKLLATLPHENLQLNLSLLSGNTIATAIQTIKQIQETGTGKGRYASDYLEGLVGILVRFTATLYEPQMLYVASNNGFTTIFKDLLMEKTSAEVKRLAATGLEKLSAESVQLSKDSKPLKVGRKLPSFSSPRFLPSRSSSKHKTTVCAIHRGVCSAHATFCLLVSGAMEALLLCLDHEDAGVIEASLSALSTLLEDNVDLEKSVGILNDVKATQQLVRLVKDHAEEGLLQKAFWMMERFLYIGGGDLAAVALQDRRLNSKLVNSFYHGNEDTRPIVKKILTHLGIVPGSSVLFS